MYIVFLLFPKNHLIKKILSISFQNRDADTIEAKKKFEDILIWAGSEKPNLLSQQLAYQVLSTEMIDLAYKSEPIKKSW